MIYFKNKIGPKTAYKVLSMGLAVNDHFFFVELNCLVCKKIFFFRQSTIHSLLDDIFLKLLGKNQLWSLPVALFYVCLTVIVLVPDIDFLTLSMNEQNLYFNCAKDQLTLGGGF